VKPLSSVFSRQLGNSSTATSGHSLIEGGTLPTILHVSNLLGKLTKEGDQWLTEAAFGVFHGT
jgi:hypothetical protein